MSISTGDISKAALWVTGREGGNYVSDPWPSKWGVSQHYHPELTAADIQAMTQERAAAMFAAQYWLPAWSGLPQYLATPMLSFAVVDGPGQAAMALQRALVVHVDGDIGQQTIGAAAGANQAAVLEAFFGECMARFMASPRWPTDGVGWCRRQVAATIAAMS